MSLRVRITAVATVAVAVALVVGAVVFGVVLRSALLDGLASSTQLAAGEIATRVETSGLSALDLDDDDGFVQILDGAGLVVLATENAQQLAPLPVADAERNALVRLPGDDEEYLLASDEADAEDGGSGNSGKGNSGSDDSDSDADSDADSDSDADELTVIVGRDASDVGETLGTVVGLLAVAVPLVALLVAITTWIVVGRALRPVERMRREVDEITASRLHRRIGDAGPAASGGSGVRGGSGDEIGRLETTLNSMLDRLDESQRAQRRFVSDASHELRSPLASLRQFAEVSRAHPDRVDASELSAAILDEGARLERLVDGMLTLARADEGVLSTPQRAVDLDDLVLGEAARLKASGRVRVDTSAVGPARILGDPGLIAQVVRNLVDNAERHSSGVLRVELAETGGRVVLAVEDDGDGVPVEQRERVFERFVRLDDARARESGGAGLGLAIVREIVAAHGGTVTAGDGTLPGARFEVRLPATSE